MPWLLLNDNMAVEIVIGVKPSPRYELGIAGVNSGWLRLGELSGEILKRCFT
jgi:hypothetical protein